MLGKDIIATLEKISNSNSGNGGVFDEKEVTALKLAMSLFEGSKDLNFALTYCEQDCYRINSEACKYIKTRVIFPDNNKYLNREVKPCEDYCAEDK